MLNDLGWQRIRDKLDESYTMKWCELKQAINYNTFKESMLELLDNLIFVHLKMCIILLFKGYTVCIDVNGHTQTHACTHIYIQRSLCNPDIYAPTSGDPTQMCLERNFDHCRHLFYLDDSASDSDIGSQNQT